MRDILVARSDSDERIETLEQEVKTLRGRAEYSEARLQQCENDMLELKAHIKRLENRFGIYSTRSLSFCSSIIVPYQALSSTQL
ncbi:hypothetical protein Tco_0430609, partial [Tanacetum coccineum]